ncbi:FAD-dependent oxidoreductase [Paracoccus sp. S-4012]|uniref:FAD/NAD(P)-dependent oxidoreductase n=1 Tax=Paracoccus sp. S-4012 TaxID=2665648 RepID=UPI001321A163|nr:FAD-dependent oxidoreductase [Paracoccus sp. S-4012]
MSPPHESYDVVVVGAGPAGIAAATVAAEGGARTLLLDENPGPGGQVWRAIDSTPLRDEALLGADYWAGRREVERLRASPAEVIHRATVWSLDRHLEIAVSVGGGSAVLQARRVILATGAMERPFPIPGWTLPGVMTAGAAQGLLKGSGLVPDVPTVLAGQGPLLWLLAAQILRAGGRIERILETTPRLTAAALRHAPGFVLSPYFRKGLALMREVRGSVPVVRVTALEALGADRLEAVRYEAGGRHEEFAAGLLLLHQGVVPEVNLAMAAGVRHGWDEAQLCWRPETDADGQTSVPGIAIAGDGAGIGGAGAATLAGRIAGHAALTALGRDTDAAALAAARRGLRRALRGRAFLDRLYRPPDRFRIPAGDTIVCRCEEVRARDVLRAVEIGAAGPNQAKAYLRAGMGPCQGRLCGLTVTELIARARGRTPQQIGHYRLRPPVKPITLEELANLPADDEARAAVVR